MRRQMVVLNLKGPASATAVSDAPMLSSPQPSVTSPSDTPLAATPLTVPPTALLADDDDDDDDDDETATRGANAATMAAATVQNAAVLPGRRVSFDAPRDRDDGDSDGDAAIGACAPWWDRTWRACCQRGSFVDPDITFAQFVATVVSDYVG